MQIDQSFAPDRESIRIRGSRLERVAFHNLARETKAKAIEARKELGRQYTLAHRGGLNDHGIVIDKTTALTTANLAQDIYAAAALNASRKIVADRIDRERPSKGSLSWFASSKEFSRDDILTEFALSPTLLLPIIDYFGMLPILYGFDINRADSEEMILSSSHMHHVDPEDITQLKVFMYMVDVDAETRPFAALPANLTQRVFDQIPTYGIAKLSDEEVAGVVGPSKERIFMGPAGTTVFCDTTRCLHYGGRPGKNIRDVLCLYYSLPTSTWYPLREGDGDKRDLTPRMSPRDNPLDKALLGRELML